MRSEKQYDYARRIYLNAISDPEVNFLEWEDIRASVIEQCDMLYLDAEIMLEHAMEFDGEMQHVKQGIRMSQNE